MSLIKCPECGKEISDKAKLCPNCGYPMNVDLKYKVNIIGYSDTDTAACAGLRDIFNSDLESDEIRNIFDNCPYTIVECDTLEEGNSYAKKFKRWGIDVEIINPDGRHEYIDKKEFENHGDASSENTIGGILKAIGIIEMIIGTFGSLYLATRGYEFEFGAFVLPEMATIVTGMMILGFSEIIQLLYHINNKLKK